MEKITNQTHSKEAFLYATSKTLERAAYYGLRSLIVLYMIGETLKMGNSEAIGIYGWFTASLILSQIIGALLGDLLIGNKNTLIIGAIVSSLGAFSLCIPSTIGLYMGLVLISLGGGLYTPNLISNFGKNYLNRIKLLDAGFSMFYFAVNLGAFIGVLVIGYVGNNYGWNIGFITSGTTMLLSLIPILLSKDKITEQAAVKKTTLGNSKKVLNISIAIISATVFWGVYELGGYRIYDLKMQFYDMSELITPYSIWSYIDSIFTLPILLLVIIFWSHFYSTQFFKLMIGFLFGALSFGLLFLIPDTPSEHHMVLYLTALLFLGVSEIHIGPIIHSVLTQYSNPKYLAILISLTMVPTRLIYILIGFFNESIFENPSVTVLIGGIIMAMTSIGLIIYSLVIKQLTTMDDKE